LKAPSGAAPAHAPARPPSRRPRLGPGSPGGWRSPALQEALRRRRDSGGSRQRRGRGCARMQRLPRQVRPTSRSGPQKPGWATAARSAPRSTTRCSPPGRKRGTASPPRRTGPPPLSSPRSRSQPPRPSERSLDPLRPTMVRSGRCDAVEVQPPQLWRQSAVHGLPGRAPAVAARVSRPARCSVEHRLRPGAPLLMVPLRCRPGRASQSQVLAHSPRFAHKSDAGRLHPASLWCCHRRRLTPPAGTAQVQGRAWQTAGRRRYSTGWALLSGLNCPSMGVSDERRPPWPNT
jgi:hypothetical protein